MVLKINLFNAVLQKERLTKKLRPGQLVAGVIGATRRELGRGTMRITSIAAGLVLAASLAAPSFTTSSQPLDNPVANTAPAQLKKKVARPLKPT